MLGSEASEPRDLPENANSAYTRCIWRFHFGMTPFE